MIKKEKYGNGAASYFKVSMLGVIFDVSLAHSEFLLDFLVSPCRLQGSAGAKPTELRLKKCV